MKSYPKWIFTTMVGISTLILGVGITASGFQDLGQPVAEWVARVAGVLLLVANPVCYLLYRKEQYNKW